MASNKTSNATEAIPDGSFDWSTGVDSSRVTTLQSQLNPNGLPRNALAWLYNGTVRDGGINQRTGWQPLFKLIASGHWQGGILYEPDTSNPYLVCVISGSVYAVQVEIPYSVTNLSAAFGLFHPDTEECFFAQGENILIIQAGDFFTNAVPTLPLFWNGTTLRRSIGIVTPVAPAMLPNINEIPAATAMWYHGQRIWYAQGRSVSAGDIVGGPSGTAGQHFRDSIISVTENPLCFGGDGFSLPTNSGNIRALREEVNLNTSVALSRLLIWTRKSVFALSVPQTRTDWINANNSNQPLLVPVQRVNGSVGDRCVVASNGDWFYQSFEPGIRSLITAVRYFTQWGNTPISQNENRALAFNDRSLMRFSGGMEFDNRMWQLALPEMAADGVNVINKAVLPLDFDSISNLVSTVSQNNRPVWEGAYDGLQFLQLFSGDFGGLPRAIAPVISDIDGSIEIWEMTKASRTENGDNRVTWGFESTAFTWSHAGLEFKLKQLNGGELWIDKLFGLVDMDVYYREDADPCWRLWFHTSLCAARNCEEKDPPCYPYAGEIFREGYRFPVVFPEPHPVCDSMGVRPTTIGYQFQVKVIIKGWCRVRGLMLYALPREKPQFQGVACPPTGPIGMAKLQPFPPTQPVQPVTPTPPTPPTPPTGGLRGAFNDLMQGSSDDQIFGAGGD